MGIPTAHDNFAQGGWTALIRAARFGHTDCVRLLLDAGADKEAKDHVRICVRLVRPLCELIAG
jgi:hypothetical protein